MFGFKGLGWFVCGVVIAPACYMVTSQGAAERARLATLENSIVAAKKEIRALETEYNTRANMTQLQQWNGETLQLAAPNPQQFLDSDTQLASIDALEAPAIEDEARPQLAAVVPSAAPRPEPAVAMRDAGPSKPAATAAVQTGQARATAVALIDDKLMRDLQQRARVEQLALR